MTRESRKIPDTFGAFVKDANSYETLFASLFANTLKVEGQEELTLTATDKKISDRKILNYLYRYGGVAFHKELGLWLPYFVRGRLTSQGYPREYALVDANGKTIAASPEEVYAFSANVARTPLAGIMHEKAKLLANLDLAINQNVDCTKQASLLVTKDPDLCAQLKLANAKRLGGEILVEVQASALNYGDIKEFKIGADYLIDKFQAAKKIVFEEALHLVGVKTPTEKRERLITSEVESVNDEAENYLLITKRSFNDDAERQNAPVRLVEYEEPKEPEKKEEVKENV